MNYKKTLFYLVFTSIIILNFSCLEELHYVRSKELTLNAQLVKSVNLLSSGNDFKKIQTDLEEVSKSVGMSDVIINIEGENIYGTIVTLQFSGNIKADTISRRILNQTEEPYKAKLEVLVAKF